MLRTPSVHVCIPVLYVRAVPQLSGGMPSALACTQPAPCQWYHCARTNTHTFAHQHGHVWVRASGHAGARVGRMEFKPVCFDRRKFRNVTRAEHKDLPGSGHCNGSDENVLRWMAARFFAASRGEERGQYRSASRRRWTVSCRRRSSSQGTPSRTSRSTLRQSAITKIEGALAATIMLMLCAVLITATASHSRWHCDVLRPHPNDLF
jgi:hypothetical protein